MNNITKAITEKDLKIPLTCRPNEPSVYSIEIPVLSLWSEDEEAEEAEEAEEGIFLIVSEAEVANVLTSPAAVNVSVLWTVNIIFEVIFSASVFKAECLEVGTGGIGTAVPEAGTWDSATW